RPRAGKPTSGEAEEYWMVYLPALVLVAYLRLDGSHVGGRHLADGGDLAVLDPPQAEGTGDVAVFVELDGTDDAFVLDGLAVLDQGEGLGELVLAGMDDRAVGIQHLADGVLDCRRIGLAGLRDGESDDGASVVGAVGGGVARIDVGETLVLGVEVLGRRRRAGAGGGAVGVIQILGADRGDEVGAVHAVVQQELRRASLRNPGAGNGGAVNRI